MQKKIKNLIFQYLTHRWRLCDAEIITLSNSPAAKTSPHQFAVSNTPAMIESTVFDS